MKGTGDRTFLHDILIDIMKNAEEDHPIQKKRIKEILCNKYDIDPSRTTLDKKLAELESKGYYVHKTSKGFYLENMNTAFKID